MKLVKLLEHVRRQSAVIGGALIVLGLILVNMQWSRPGNHRLAPGICALGLGLVLAFMDQPLRVFVSGEIEDGGWSELLRHTLLVAGGMLVAAGGLVEWLWPGSVSSRLAAWGWGQFAAGAGLLLVISAALLIAGTLETRG
ncbi:MAG: hypothetical protein D6790_12405, partial [Caldilineae bacterium]